jgi:LysM repeat protein
MLKAPAEECIEMWRIRKSRDGIVSTCACRKIRTIELLTTARKRVKNPSLKEAAAGKIQPLQTQCPTGIMWTVQPGDTLFNIARATGTTVERIVALNPNLQPENLEPGMQICLPEETALPRGPIPPCASGLYWVVAQGDSLFSIARTYGTTVERLLELNPGIDPLNLQIGMSICLPG